MIPNQWYAILSAKKVQNKPVPIKRFGLDLLLWRQKDRKLICMTNRCPHRGVRLDLGSIKNDRIVCKYHGFQFNGQGRCVFLPCDNKSENISKSLNVSTFELREENDLVWLWWGDEREDKPPIPWIDGVPKKAGIKEMAIVWPQHYCRSIETNFDGSHFPFVHGSVLPGLGEHVREISCDGDHNLLTGSMTMGHPPESKKFKKKTFSFNCQFKFPNLSTISFGQLYGGLIIDTPIDDRHTWRYMRVSKFPFNIPIISDVLARMAIFFDWFITQRMQDQKIIATMEPKYPVEGAHHFVKADLGIARYRSLRKSLIREALTREHDFPPHVREELRKAVDIGGISPAVVRRTRPTHS